MTADRVDQILGVLITLVCTSITLAHNLGHQTARNLGTKILHNGLHFCINERFHHLFDLLRREQRGLAPCEAAGLADLDRVVVQTEVAWLLALAAALEVAALGRGVGLDDFGVLGLLFL